MTGRGTSKPALYGLLGVLLVLWSSNFIFTKFALRGMPLASVVGWRYVLAGVCMLPVIGIGRRDPAWQARELKWMDAPAVMAVTLLGLVGNQVLFVIGISMTSVAHAAIITALGPVLVLIGSYAMGKEQVTILRAVGMLIAGCGVAVLQFGRGGTGGSSALGDAVMLLSVMVFAAFNILGKPLAERFGSMKMNAFAYGGAAVLAVPVVLTKWHDAMQAGSLAWVGVTYMAVGSSVLGYLIYAHALRHLPASRVSIVVLLQPILASLLALAVLGEQPGGGFIPAAALVLGGVYTVERFS